METLQLDPKDIFYSIKYVGHGEDFLVWVEKTIVAIVERCNKEDKTFEDKCIESIMNKYKFVIMGTVNGVQEQVLMLVKKEKND